MEKEENCGEGSYEISRANRSRIIMEQTDILQYPSISTILVNDGKSSSQNSFRYFNKSLSIDLKSLE